MESETNGSRYTDPGQLIQFISYCIVNKALITLFISVICRCNVNSITDIREHQPYSEKSAQKFLGLPFCCTVEHVQLKNVTVGVMNIIVTIAVGVKYAPESRMHQNAPF